MVKAFRPKNLDNALDIRGSEKTVPFAGGTDLMVKHRRCLCNPPDLPEKPLFLGHLDELRRIEIQGEFLSIGASCTLTEILKNNLTPEPLKMAISNMASVGIRNIATIGGNICNSSPAGDTLPVLYALGAEMIIRSRDKSRRVAISKFIDGPCHNTLEFDELLTGVLLPLEDFTIISYKKVGTRRATALAKISFLGLASFSGDIIEDIRISFGAVAPTVVRSPELEKRMIGFDSAQLESIIEEIAENYSGMITPITDQRSSAGYRKTISIRLLKEFLNNTMYSRT